MRDQREKLRGERERSGGGDEVQRREKNKIKSLTPFSVKS